jgi:hypothetical protein
MWTSKSQCCGGGVVVISARKGVQVDGGGFLESTCSWSGWRGWTR